MVGLPEESMVQSVPSAFHLHTSTPAGLTHHVQWGGSAAAAAWLTWLVHSVELVGLSSIVEPTSSASTSSTSELTWVRSKRLWALPVWATSWTPAHWVELSPELVTATDWLISELSASCSDSWEVSKEPPPPLLSSLSLSLSVYWCSDGFSEAAAGAAARGEPSSANARRSARPRRSLGR